MQCKELDNYDLYECDSFFLKLRVCDEVTKERELFFIRELVIEFCILLDSSAVTFNAQGQTK